MRHGKHENNGVPHTPWRKSRCVADSSSRIPHHTYHRRERSPWNDAVNFANSPYVFPTGRVIRYTDTKLARTLPTGYHEEAIQTETCLSVLCREVDDDCELESLPDVHESGAHSTNYDNQENRPEELVSRSDILRFPLSMSSTLPDGTEDWEQPRDVLVELVRSVSLNLPPFCGQEESTVLPSGLLPTVRDGGNDEDSTTTAPLRRKRQVDSLESAFEATTRTTNRGASAKTFRSMSTFTTLSEKREMNQQSEDPPTPFPPPRPRPSSSSWEEWSRPPSPKVTTSSPYSLGLRASLLRRRRESFDFLTNPDWRNDDFTDVASVTSSIGDASSFGADWRLGSKSSSFSEEKLRRSVQRYSDFLDKAVNEVRAVGIDQVRSITATPEPKLGQAAPNRDFLQFTPPVTPGDAQNLLSDGPESTQQKRDTVVVVFPNRRRNSEDDIVQFMRRNSNRGIIPSTPRSTSQTMGVATPPMESFADDLLRSPQSTDSQRSKFYGDDSVKMELGALHSSSWELRRELEMFENQVRANFAAEGVGEERILELLSGDEEEHSFASRDPCLPRSRIGSGDLPASDDQFFSPRSWGVRQELETIGDVRCSEAREGKFPPSREMLRLSPSLLDRESHYHRSYGSGSWNPDSVQKQRALLASVPFGAPPLPLTSSGEQEDCDEEDVPLYGTMPTVPLPWPFTKSLPPTFHWEIKEGFSSILMQYSVWYPQYCLDCFVPIAELKWMSNSPFRKPRI